MSLAFTDNLLFQLSSSLLDPHGPFEVRNALRDLPPAATHNLAIKFSPITGGKVSLFSCICVLHMMSFIFLYSIMNLSNSTMVMPPLLSSD